MLSVIVACLVLLPGSGRKLTGGDRNSLRGSPALVLETGTPKSNRTALAPAACSATRCAMTWPPVPPDHHQEGVSVGRLRAPVVLRGESNVRWLQERGVTSGTNGQAAQASLGPVYGVQWGPGPRRRDHVDRSVPRWNCCAAIPIRAQHRLRPGRRRDPQMALPPCTPSSSSTLPRQAVCQLYQRSADLFSGCLQNAASAADT